MLAARVVLEQGVHVEGLNIFTGFCVEGHTHAIRNVKRAAPRRNHALWVAEQLGIKLHIVEVIEEYKKVLLAPRHGYGANLNPCLDCKSFMVGKARAWMNEQGFDFIVTGEVIGQRPKSQTRKKLPLISRESGAFDLLLRPLSGRSRGRQIDWRHITVSRIMRSRPADAASLPMPPTAVDFGTCGARAAPGTTTSTISCC